MTQNRLNILVPEESSVIQSEKRNLKEIEREKFTRLWDDNPEQFNPMRNPIERERLKRTWQLIEEHFSPKGRQVIDLGCGYGILSERLAEKEAYVHAVDIVNAPLNRLQNKQIRRLTTSEEYVPHTHLPDEAYDLVIATELIAYLHPNQFRLFFSELARIIQPSGLLICSTPVDIHSDDALQKFGLLVETEFNVEKWIFSYHAYYIRLLHALKAPERFVRGRIQPQYREKEIEKRKGLSRFWFRINSTAMAAFFWRAINFLVKPLHSLLEQSQNALLFLERICKFLSPETGISHVILVGHRRPLVEPIPEKERPVEHKQRKQIWE